MIKNIIFDLGNVLINFDFNRFFAVCGYKSNERFVSEAEPVLKEFDAGKISRTEFYEQMKQVFNFELTQIKFEEAWCDNFWENSELIDFARKLSKKYNVFILSNTDEIHFPYIWQKFPALHFFRANLMLSYKLKTLKPGRLIFEKALRKFELKPDECLFIDDLEKNVKAATTCGLYSVWHRSNEETCKKISKILTRKT